jgi:hypothetical protein
MAAAMTDIVVTPLQPGHYGVEVREGTDRTGHELVIDQSLLDDLQLSDYDERVVAEEIVAFLLDREPADAIEHHIWVRDVDRRHPDFRDELVARVEARATPS